MGVALGAEKEGSLQRYWYLCAPTVLVFPPIVESGPHSSGPIVDGGVMPAVPICMYSVREIAWYIHMGLTISAA